jgi:hypothetical protein
MCVQPRSLLCVCRANEAFVESASHAHAPSAFTDPFNAQSPIARPAAPLTSPAQSVIERLKGFTPLFGARAEQELPANLKLWHPPPTARTAAGHMPFAVPKTLPRQFGGPALPPHLLPGAPPPTAPSPERPRFDPNLQAAAAAAPPPPTA